MDLGERLRAELARRRADNPHYSLRAFARDLGADHAALSQVLRGRRVLSPRKIRAFGRRLKWTEAEIAEAVEVHHAEAILRLLRRPAFRANSRWIATRTGLPLDATNAALSRLLRERRLVMETRERWVVPILSHA